MLISVNARGVYKFRNAPKERKKKTLHALWHHPPPLFPPLRCFSHFSIIYWPFCRLLVARPQAYVSVCLCVCFFVYAEMNTASHTNRGGLSHPSQVTDVCLYHMLVRELTSHVITGNCLSRPQGEHTEEMVLTHSIFTLLKYLLDNILGEIFFIYNYMTLYCKSLT